MNGSPNSASVLVASPVSFPDQEVSRFSRWGGLLAALTTTEDFKTASRDDPDIEQMVDTVQRLEASLQDCAVHGPQKMVDAFTACQLTPALLNRWNSPVLDGLWQAVTGRTPDGVTPFALNPPHDTAELLNRLIWPRAYPEAVDLVLGLKGVPQGGSVVLPAIVTCACAGYGDILKRLLLASPIDQIARVYLLHRLPMIAACGQIACCELLFPLVVPFGIAVRDEARPIATALTERAAAGALKVVKFLLSHYDFAAIAVEQAAIAACSSSPAPDETFQLLFDSVRKPSEHFLPGILRAAASSNRIAIVQQILEHGVDAAACAEAAVDALTLGCGTEVLNLLLPRLNPEDREEVIVMAFRCDSDSFSLNIVNTLVESLRDHPRLAVQHIMDEGLVQAVSRVRPDHAKMFLHHGAHARAGDDYILYLAALSGRADVMELLLGAADVDAECAARYRQQMSQPTGLLGLAQQLRESKSELWSDATRRDGALVEPRHELCAALIGGSVPALEWLMIPPTRCRLESAWPLMQAVTAGSVALVRVLLDPRSVDDLNSNSRQLRSFLTAALNVARESYNFVMIKLLFDSSVPKQNLSLSDIRQAVQANDPFTRR